MQGCFTPAPQLVMDTAGHQFVRCPLTYVDSHSLLLMRMGEDEYLKQVGPDRALRLPAKRHAALIYITNFLLKIRATNV